MQDSALNRRGIQVQSPLHIYLHMCCYISYVCMTCMYVCIYVCMYVCVCMYVWYM